MKLRRPVGAGITVGIGSSSKLVVWICEEGSLPLTGWEEKPTQPPIIAATEAAVMNHLVAGAPKELWFDFFAVMLMPLYRRSLKFSVNHIFRPPRFTQTSDVCGVFLDNTLIVVIFAMLVIIVIVFLRIASLSGNLRLGSAIIKQHPCISVHVHYTRIERDFVSYRTLVIDQFGSSEQFRPGCCGSRYQYRILG